jgi:hypothetical protein
MYKNRVAAMLAIAVFAGALVTAGCVSAATKPPASAATVSARAAAATGGTANIMIYGVNTDGAYWHAIVSGVLGDYGPAVSIYPDGKVDRPALVAVSVLLATTVPGRRAAGRSNQRIAPTCWWPSGVDRRAAAFHPAGTFG